MPPLNALRAFESAARHGSFVAAGRELNVTAAAVSQQVRSLERFVGSRLFERLAHGLVLSESGRRHLPELTGAFDRLTTIAQRLRSIEAAGTLTLSTLPAFASGWLLPRLPRFRARYPRIELVLETSRSLVDFRRQNIDVAIRFSAGAQRELRSIDLFGEDVFPVASPALLGGAQAPLGLPALLQWPLLHDVDAQPEQPWMNWRSWFEREGLALPIETVGLSFSDSIVLTSAAVQGLGIALGRSVHIGAYLARGQLVRLTALNWPAAWRYALTAPAAHFARPNVKAFTDWMKGEAQSAALSLAAAIGMPTRALAGTDTSL